MKTSRFSEQQISYALRQSEAGTKVQDICRQLGISQATLYGWKNKFGGMGVNELRRLRQLEQENAHLKKLVADLSLDRQMLQDVIKKSCKACRKDASGAIHDGGLPCFGQAGLPNATDTSIDALLQGS